MYVGDRHLGATRQVAAGLDVNTPALPPLISPTVAVRLSDHGIIRAVWHRVVTNDNRDSDVFLIGAGHRWQ